MHTPVIPGRESRELLATAGAQYARAVPRYGVHDTTGDDLGLVEHAAPNLEPGDVVEPADGREALVTARVETEGGELAALLEVVVAPSRLDADDALP